MFKMVTGNNGRTVYYGVITGRNENEMDVKGVEWDKETKTEVTKMVHLSIDPDCIESASGLKTGDAIIFSMLPSRKDPNKGVAEEICSNNGCIHIVNENGNEKYVLIADVKGKKWNEKRTCLQLNFRDVKEFDGEFVGYNSSRIEYGVNWGACYLNVIFFNNKDKKSQSADFVDKKVKAGDKVVMVISKKNNMYNGKEYTNYYGSKYEIV